MKSWVEDEEEEQKIQDEDAQTALARVLETMNEKDIWASLTIGELYAWLKCSVGVHNPNDPRGYPIYRTSTWALMREAYREIMVAEAASSIPVGDGDGEVDQLSGFEVAFRTLKTANSNDVENARQLDGRNYAVEEISKGTLVWKSTYTAQFNTTDEYRRFLQRLPSDLACEALMMIYTRYSSSGDPVLCLALDPGAFTVEGTPEGSNIKLGTTMNDFQNTGCYMEHYATRDIAAGEELILDSDFSAPVNELISLGLMLDEDRKSGGQEIDMTVFQERVYDPHSEL